MRVTRNDTWRARRGVLTSFPNMDISTLIQAWPRIQTEVWDKITFSNHHCPLPSSSGTIEVWEWIINLTIRIAMNGENVKKNRGKWYCNLLPVFNIVFHRLMNLKMWAIKQRKKPVSHDNNLLVKSHNFIEESTDITKRCNLDTNNSLEGVTHGTSTSKVWIGSTAQSIECFFLNKLNKCVFWLKKNGNAYYMERFDTSYCTNIFREC